LFNLDNDPYELINLSGEAEYDSIHQQLLKELEMWQKITGDTIKITSGNILPLEYDYRKLARKPDRWQPEYTLKKYFYIELN